MPDKNYSLDFLAQEDKAFDQRILKGSRDFAQNLMTGGQALASQQPVEQLKQHFGTPQSPFRGMALKGKPAPKGSFVDVPEKEGKWMYFD